MDFLTNFIELIAEKTVKSGKGKRLEIVPGAPLAVSPFDPKRTLSESILGEIFAAQRSVLFSVNDHHKQSVTTNVTRFLVTNVTRPPPRALNSTVPGRDFT